MPKMMEGGRSASPGCGYLLTGLRLSGHGIRQVGFQPVSWVVASIETKRSRDRWRFAGARPGGSGKPGVRPPELHDRLGRVEVRRYRRIPHAGRRRPVVAAVEHGAMEVGLGPGELLQHHLVTPVLPGIKVVAAGPATTPLRFSISANVKDCSVSSSFCSCWVNGGRYPVSAVPWM